MFATVPGLHLVKLLGLGEGSWMFCFVALILSRRFGFHLWLPNNIQFWMAKWESVAFFFFIEKILIQFLVSWTAVKEKAKGIFLFFSGKISFCWYLWRCCSVHLLQVCIRHLPVTWEIEIVKSLATSKNWCPFQEKRTSYFPLPGLFIFISTAFR